MQQKSDVHILDHAGIWSVNGVILNDSLLSLLHDDGNHKMASSKC